MSKIMKGSKLTLSIDGVVFAHCDKVNYSFPPIPKCHFTEMVDKYKNHRLYWVCKHCGHTKEVKLNDS